MLSYAPGSSERLEIKKALENRRSQVIDIPMIINGQEVRTENIVDIFPPHDRNHKIGKL